MSKQHVQSLCHVLYVETRTALPISVSLPPTAETFEISDGVRGAKAADIVGNKSIPANILDEGKVVGTQDFQVKQPLSPKPILS